MELLRAVIQKGGSKNNTAGVASSTLFYLPNCKVRTPPK
jgi:hypothetical protein